MFVETEISDGASASERLARFAILDEHQSAFARISEILRDSAEHLASIYVEHFLEAANFRLDDEAKSALIVRIAQYSRGKFSPPIDAAWIARIEQAGELQFKTGASTLALLSALSWSHRAAAAIISRRLEDPEDRRYLVGQFMRISALEVEILVSTVSRLEKRRYRRTLAANAKAFDESIADIIQSSNRLSAEARVKASASVDAARALLDLSGDVSSASAHSTDAMAEVAEKTGDLRDAIETIDGDLGFTLDRLAEFSETARRAEQSALTLADDTHTIEALLKLIRSIADQAKILSLNALVEAASAGEAGLGFRVVANEMKDLAERTEQATAQIGSQVTNIRQTSDASRTAHATMRQQFDGLKTTTDRMRQTLNAQARSVKEITRCVEDTAMGAKASSRAIGQMEAGIEDLSGAIGAVSAEVTALDTSLLSLRTTADAFTAKLRA